MHLAPNITLTKMPRGQKPELEKCLLEKAKGMEVPSTHKKIKKPQNLNSFQVLLKGDFAQKTFRLSAFFFSCFIFNLFEFFPPVQSVSKEVGMWDLSCSTVH